MERFLYKGTYQKRKEKRPVFSFNMTSEQYRTRRESLEFYFDDASRLDEPYLFGWIFLKLKDGEMVRDFAFKLGDSFVFG